MDKPGISIGLPTYNSMSTISKVIDSILSQTYVNFEVVVCDNASSDGSYEYLLEISNIDPRIRLFRNKFTVDPLVNFKNCLSFAQGNYFMWWASDDTRSSNFLENNIKFLISNLSYIASTSIYKMDSQSSFNKSIMCLTGEQHIRIKAFIDNSYNSNGIFYLIATREQFQSLVSLRTFKKSVPIIDWIIIIEFLLKGNINIDRASSTIFGSTGDSSNPNGWKVHRTSFFRLFIYYYDMFFFMHKSRSLMKSRTKLVIAVWCIKMQLNYFKVLLLEFMSYMKKLLLKIFK